MPSFLRESCGLIVVRCTANLPWYIPGFAGCEKLRDWLRLALIVLVLPGSVRGVPITVPSLLLLCVVERGGIVRGLIILVTVALIYSSYSYHCY